MASLRNIVLAIGCGAAFSVAAFGCECAEGWNAEAAFRRSALVFRGRIDESFLSRALEWYGIVRTRAALCTFRIQEEFKGEASRFVRVYDGIGGAGGGACAVPFEDGVEYLVYAYRDADGRLWTDFCTGTKPVGNAEEIGRLRLWKRDASRSKTGR